MGAVKTSTASCAELAALAAHCTLQEDAAANAEYLPDSNSVFMTLDLRTTGINPVDADA